MTSSRLYRIYNTDAFEWLKKRKACSIHAVVSDPPYGVVEYSAEQLDKRRNGNGGIWRLPQNFDGSIRQPQPRFTVLKARDIERIQKFYSKLAKSLFRVLTPGGHVILASHCLFSDIVSSSFKASGFQKRGEIIRVVKTLRGGDRPKNAHEEFPEVSVIPRSCWEPWGLFRKPFEGRVADNLEKWGTGALRRPSVDQPFSDLIQSAPASKVEKNIAPHSSLKPQHFMRQVVRASLPLGNGTILDPFMGSGSTIAAAKHLGLKSIGLELDQEYFEMAEKAISKLAEIELAQ